MKRIVWEIQPLSTIKINRYCKKCKKKTYYHSTNVFRINAQKKQLDIWLIYQCQECKNRWNIEIMSRVNCNLLSKEKLDQYHRNDRKLITYYTMNQEFLKNKKRVLKLPEYDINGELGLFDTYYQLKIINSYQISYPILNILKKGLKLHKKELIEMIEQNRIVSIPSMDLKKAKLGKSITLHINYLK